MNDKKKEIYETNRGSPSFRMNSIELEIETIIRKLVQKTNIKMQDIQNKLINNYSNSDVVYVIKHSKGLWLDSDDTVEYREWVYADTEIDVGV